MVSSLLEMLFSLSNSNKKKSAIIVRNRRHPYSAIFRCWHPWNTYPTYISISAEDRICQIVEIQLSLISHHPLSFGALRTNIWPTSPLGRGQNLWGTRAGSWSRGARTFFGKKYDGLGLFFFENKGGLYFFCEKIWRARTFFLETLRGPGLFSQLMAGVWCTLAGFSPKIYGTPYILHRP